jgi:hypothetical protein
MAEFNIKSSKVGQINESGDNIRVTTTRPARRALLDALCTWFGLIASIATIGAGVLCWYGLHLQFGLWFWGMR